MTGSAVPNTRLLDAVRGLSADVALSEMDDDGTTQVLHLLEAARRLLVPAYDVVPRRDFAHPASLRSAGRAWLAGEFNPVVPQLRISHTADGAEAPWVSGPLDEGPRGSVHGGISAFLLDVISGGLLQGRGLRAVTARLEIGYARPVPLGAPVLVRARLSASEGRKHTVDSEIVHDGIVAVRGTGLFVTVPAPVSSDGIGVGPA